MGLGFRVSGVSGFRVQGLRVLGFRGLSRASEVWRIRVYSGALGVPGVSGSFGVYGDLGGFRVWGFMGLMADGEGGDSRS